jgi:hypothetical protein
MEVPSSSRLRARHRVETNSFLCDVGVQEHHLGRDDWKIRSGMIRLRYEITS